MIKILFFQPKCESCLRTQFDDVDDNFHPTRCKKCGIAVFCSDTCRLDGYADHRSRQCNDLKEIAASEMTLENRLRELGPEFTAVSLYTETLRTTYKTLSTVNSWAQYFGDVQQQANVDYITETFKPAAVDAMSESKWLHFRLATSISTHWLTILAGLEHELPDLATRKRLTVHIVGADKQNTRSAKMAEELIHLLPNLRELNLCYVGPDATQPQIEKKLIRRCEACREQRRPQQKVFQSGRLYHDYIQNGGCQLRRPNLIVAFHSNHSEPETGTWTPTLNKILDLGIPALFTTYNKHQATEEKRIFNGIGAYFSQKMEWNRWSGVLPLFNTSLGRYDVGHLNEYWYIVKGRRTISGADVQPSG